MGLAARILEQSPTEDFRDMIHDEVENVIWGLQRMSPRNSLAKEEIRKLIGCLQNNREKIHYPSDRIGGYPIGSGGIGFANKFICHRRMKRFYLAILPDKRIYHFIVSFPPPIYQWPPGLVLPDSLWAYL